MKDIFGRPASNYHILANIRKKGGNVQRFLEEQRDYLLHEAGGRIDRKFMRQHATTPHQFFKPQDLTTRLRDVELSDTGGTGFIFDNFQAFTTMNAEIFYREFRLRDYMPVLTDGVQEGATSYAITVRDRVGRAVFGTPRDGNTPRADTNLRKYDAPLDTGKIDIGWDEEDLRNSLFANRSIQTDKMEAAVVACNTTIEETGFFGAEAIPDSYGLFTIPTSGANAGAEQLFFSAENLGSGVAVDDTWASLTPDEKVVALQRLIRRPIHNSKEIIIQRGRIGLADLVIALPPDIYDDVCETAFGDDKNTTVKLFVERTNAWFNRTGRQVMWMSTTELSEAGTEKNSSKKRIMVYVKDEEVMHFRIVIAPRMIRLVQTPREVVGPYEFKTGTFQVLRSGLVTYLDGA